MRKVLIGLLAATALLGAVVAYATSVHPLDVCGPTGANDCKGKISVKFWNAYSGACYSVKVSCKGNYVGTDWEASVSGAGGESLRVATFAIPTCQAAGFDPGGVKGLKATCEADSVKICANSSESASSAKVSVERRDDLCPVTCVKRDKAGNCP